MRDQLAVKTHHGVRVSGPLQVIAALSVGVGADAQTVGGVELLHEERTASLDHCRQLQQAGGRQQRLNGVLPQIEPAWRTKKGRWMKDRATEYEVSYYLKGFEINSDTAHRLKRLVYFFAQY